MSKHDVRAASKHPTITPPPPPAAEWMPLDALVAHWADFARLSEARSALTLELVGDAAHIHQAGQSQRAARRLGGPW